LFSPQFLRAPSADWRKILHCGGKYVHFYNAGSKFWRAFPQKKFSGQKHAKFDAISDEVLTLTTNIFGMDDDIQNWTSTRLG